MHSRSLPASRILESLLVGVRPVDALTYATAPLLLLVTALLACWIPAWRAGTTDPAVTLRAE